MEPWPAPRWPAGTLLSRLDPAALDELGRRGTPRQIATGGVVIRQGEADSTIVVLWDAFAKVTVATPDGRDALLAVRMSGDLVGEMSALNNRPRSATVTVCRPSRVRVLSQASFRSFLANNPGAALELAAMVADRLRWANRRRVDFASYPVPVRLMRIIAELAIAYGYRTPDGVVVDLHLTQPELATLCGAAQVSIQKALRDLRKHDLIRTGYRRITVVDLAELAAACDVRRDGADDRW